MSPGLAELYQPRREAMCFDGNFCRLSPGSASPVSSNTSGAPKQAAAQTPVKTENCCVVSPLVGQMCPLVALLLPLKCD
jgi:hypothetical protein